MTIQTIIPEAMNCMVIMTITIIVLIRIRGKYGSNMYQNISQ